MRSRPRWRTRRVRGILLDVDSPGGEVGGLFDLVTRIRALKAASGIPLWAVANEDALSAAYAIVSAADRIYVTQTGEVGSIGVVAAHVDESGADAQAGLSWSFVFAGQQKVDGNAHEPLSQRARDTIQADVDRLYGEFCALVAANRDLTVEAVRGTQAAIYRGESRDPRRSRRPAWHPRPRGMPRWRPSSMPTLTAHRTHPNPTQEHNDGDERNRADRRVRRQPHS